MRSFALTLSFLGAALAAHAQEPGPAPGDAAEGQRTTLTLDVRDAPLPQVIGFIRAQTGRNILLGKDGAGRSLDALQPPLRVTVRFEDVPWAQALVLVADSAKCLVERSGEVWVVFQPPEATIEVERAPLRDVIQAIAAASGANLVVGSDVPTDLLVSVRLRNIPWRHALNAVVRSVGMVVLRESESNVWIVRDPEQLKRVLDTRVIRLHRLRGREIEVRGRLRVVLPVERDEQPLDLLEEVARQMTRDAGGSPVGALDYDMRTHSILLTDTSLRLDMIESLIAEFDGPTRSERDEELRAALDDLRRLESELGRLRQRLEKLR